jgi:hypothetical protein
MFTIVTRVGSASARKSVAVASASSSERLGAASGAQQEMRGRVLKSTDLDV